MNLKRDVLALAIACAVSAMVLTFPEPSRAGTTQSNRTAHQPSSQQTTSNKKDTNSATIDKQTKEKVQNLKGIVVTGIRASMESAAFRKRYANQIMESIVAQDIGKLPDTNVADALGRVTGVQITQDKGEGSTVSIRGLTQIETQLNGNPVFTASGGRTLNFEDIPAGLLAGIDVYKTPTADQIEGGIGGIVNLRTHRPFDFKGFKANASAGVTYADQIGKSKPRASGLLSNIWDTGIGRVGALIAVSYQERPFLQKYTELTHPSTLTGVTVENGTSSAVGDQTIHYPPGEYIAYDYGTRRRVGINGSLQWQPLSNLLLHLDTYYADFKSKGNTEAMYLNTSFASGYDDLTLYPGTSDLESGTFHTVGVQPETFTKDTRDKTHQIAAGLTWNASVLTLKANASYTYGTHYQNFNELTLYGGAPSLSIDTNPTVPAIDYNGFDITDPDNFTYSQTNYYHQRNKGKEKSVRLDAAYHVAGDFIRDIKFGYRYSDRNATDKEINDVEWAAASGANYFGQPSSSISGMMNPTRFDDLGSWVTPDPDRIRDAQGIYNQFNLGELPSFEPLSTYFLSEYTNAVYLESTFGAYGSVPTSGNIGVRVVRTRESVNANKSLDGVVSPVHKSNDYVDLLPSFNIKFNLTDSLLLRLAGSKTMTRPSFSDLSPALVLTNIFHTGSGGNPDLDPMYGTGFDGSLGWYFGKGNYVFGDVFYKKVKGFIAYATDVEQFHGENYQITRPINSDSGNLRGVELAYQQFFRSLPGWMSGLGMKLNYTYVDSSVTGIIPNKTTPLPSLSKNSYNIILMYGSKKFWARLAYNWRSNFLSSTYYTDTSLEPIYMKGYGILDASIGFKLSPHTTLGIYGVNLLQNHKTSYYLRPTLPNESYLEDRRIVATLRFDF